MKYSEVSLGTTEAVFNKLGGKAGINRFLAGRSKVVDATLSTEDVCRILLNAAVEDGLIKMTGALEPLQLGSVDLTFVVKKLNTLFATEHIINCDVDPYVPDDWKVEEHIKSGHLVWNPDEVEPWLCDEQKYRIDGYKLRELLKDKPVLNACVLDYLLANPHLIPREWRSKVVLFWGTIYHDSDGDLCVRSLFWDYGRWAWGDYRFGNYISDNNLVALSCK